MNGSCRCKGVRARLKPSRSTCARLKPSRAMEREASSRRAIFAALAVAFSGCIVSASTDLPLIRAVKNKDLAAVRTLLKQHVDVNATEGDGTTALHWASHRDDLGIADALIRSGARANAANDLGATALHLACTNRSAAMVERLLAAGGNPNATLLNGETVLMTCARAGDARAVKALIARGADAESAQLLLKAGADANESQPDGVSALVLAAHSGNGPFGAVLLEHGADPNAFGSGYTALHAAILRSYLNLVKALLAHGAKPDVRIAKGTPMRRDTTDWNLPATLIGSTPYLLAARFLEPAIMSALVAGGADAAATLANGADAVMLAAGMGSSRTASRRGIETIDFGKVEPESRVRETVAAAVDLQGDVTAASQSGDTALHVAAALGHDSVVQLLVERGAGVGIKNRRGITPLAAAMFGSTIGRGRAAAPAGADSLGFEPPIELAHPTTVALLKKLGATE